MTTAQATETAVVEKLINASAETIWQLWTDESKIADWFVPAKIDARDGGAFTLDLPASPEPGDKSRTEMRGHFTEFSPYERLAFTWGLKEEWFGVPPESTSVTVELEPRGEATLVRITHAGLPADRDSSPYSERKGWTHMLDQMAELFA